MKIYLKKSPIIPFNKQNEREMQSPEIRNDIPPVHSPIILDALEGLQLAADRAVENNKRREEWENRSNFEIVTQNEDISDDEREKMYKAEIEEWENRPFIHGCDSCSFPHDFRDFCPQCGRAYIA